MSEHIEKPRVKKKAFKQSRLLHITEVSDQARRLRRLRSQAGYARIVDLAKEMGVSPGTYNHHENGTRRLTGDAAQAYARFFDVPVGWLLYGELTRAQPMVLLVGRIRDDGWATAINYKPASKKEKPQAGGYNLALFSRLKPVSYYSRPQLVPAPPGVPRDMALGMAAVRVETDHLLPHYCQGDIIFYDPVKLDAVVDRDRAHNQRCVVLTIHDELRVGIIQVQPDYSIVMTASGSFPETDFGHPKAVWPVTHIACKATLFS